MRLLKVTIYRTITGTFAIELPKGSEEEQAIRDLLQDVSGDQFSVLTDDFVEIEEETEDGKVKRSLSLSGPSAFQQIDGGEPSSKKRQNAMTGPLVLKGPPHPSLPDLETMRRYQAELEADKTAHSLSEPERQERLAFLIQGVNQYWQAFPPENMKAISEDIKRLLKEVQARRQARQSQDE